MNGLLSKHKLGQMLQAAKQSPTLYLNIHLRPFKLWMINGKTCHVWTQLEHPGWTPRRVADICIMPIRPCFTGAQVVNGSKQFNLNFSKKCYWFSKGEVVIFVLYLGFKLPCKKLRHLEVCKNESFGDIVWILPPLPSHPSSYPKYSFSTPHTNFISEVKSLPSAVKIFSWPFWD